MSLNDSFFIISFSFFLLLLFSGYYLKRQNRKRSISELYSPAYGLLLSKRSKKLDSDEFRYLFRDLLIKKSHLARNPQIRIEMKEWLRNNRDPEGYRLQMLLETKLDYYYNKRRISIFLREFRR